MSVRVNMTSTDIDRQIELLKFYPEVVVKYYRPALVSATSETEALIRPTIPIGKTGRLFEWFGSKVSGRQITTIQGLIGWPKKTPPYAHLVEDGVATHDIEPRKKISKSRFDAGKGLTTKLKWASGYDGGDFVFRSKVTHPGFSGRHFMAAGYSAMKPIIEALMNNAGEGIVKELALK